MILLYIVASAHGVAMKNHWFLDRRFMIAVVSVVFILPWLFPRRIGILSYTRCVLEREGERGRERERERGRERGGGGEQERVTFERDKIKEGTFNQFLVLILI